MFNDKNFNKMKQQTELTAADLALCLGCEVEWMGERGYFLAGINTGQENFNPVGLVSEQMEPVWVKFDEITPILRPLSDMTETEARAVWEKCYGDDFGDGECLLHLIATVDADERNDSEFDVLLGYPDGWRYLLSRHFDLFGWIAAGLAIDKTKIETK